MIDRVEYVELKLCVSDSDGVDDGGVTFRLEAYSAFPALLPDEAAHRLPELIAPLVASLVAAMQRELRENGVSE